MNRAQAISHLASMIADIHLNRPVRVGIDGVDASGKTTLADELVRPLQARDRTVIRASIDGFHNPREIRYRQGRRSPRGYYDDSFNFQAIITNLLEPLGPDGNLKYRPIYFDFKTNSEVHPPVQVARSDAILLFDGVFLHRPELKDYWDLSVFVQVDFEIAVRRAQDRDRHLFETAEEIRAMYLQRYIPGQQLYLDAETPASQANVLWINNEIANPDLIVNDGG